MTISENIRDEILQYDVNRQASKVSATAQVKLINMDILQVKKYCLLIIEE